MRAVKIIEDEHCKFIGVEVNHLLACRPAHYFGHWPDIPMYLRKINCTDLLEIRRKITNFSWPVSETNIFGRTATGSIVLTNFRRKRIVLYPPSSSSLSFATFTHFVPKFTTEKKKIYENDHSTKSRWAERRARSVRRLKLFKSLNLNHHFLMASRKILIF